MADKAESTEYFRSPGHHVYDGIIYTVGFDAPLLDRIRYEYQLREDDVLVSSYPKAGTSWMQGIVSLIYNPDNLEDTAKISIDQRVPFLEFTSRGEEPELDSMLENRKSPRLIKTHLPARFFRNHENMMNKKTKTIYVMRNPKDTLVSYYHFYRMNEYFGCYQGTWSEYFELFKARQIGLGDWFDMVLEWWQYKDVYNIHFVKYEDLQRDLKGGVREIADYLGQPLTEEQLNKIVELTTFKSMRHEMKGIEGLKDDISPFMRKGQAGDWVNYFTQEQNEYFDELYKRKMEGSGLAFDFTL